MTNQLKSPEARKRIMAARTALVLDEPFFGTLALRLVLKEDPTCPTAWTDGQSLGYSPQFVMLLKQHELVALLLHEVMHCSNGHPWRRDNRDMGRWNVACDRAINPVLRDAGYKLPADGLYELEPSHKGKSAEWIYDRLPRGTPQQPQSGGGQGQGQGQGQSQGQSTPQPNGAGNSPSRPQAGGKGPSDGQPSQSPKSSGPGHPEKNAGPVSEGHNADHKSNSLGEVRDAPADVEGADEHVPTEEDWRQATTQAANLAKGQGKLPAALKRFAKDAGKPRIDWRSAVRRFAQEVTRSDYSFSRPNARYVAHQMYLPSLRSYEVGVLAIGVDTSGSIDHVLLNQFAAEIRAIADEVRPRQIRVLYCDARVHREETFEQDEPITLHMCGGGGTDFRPVFDAITKWEDQPVAVVYLTDLMGTFPEKEPGIPTLWVTGKDDAEHVPFGELVTAA